MKTLKSILVLLGIVALLLAALYYFETPPDNAPAVAALGVNFEPLRAAFNADAGKVRLLMILDPT
jgi:hypothetical protein